MDHQLNISQAKHIKSGLLSRWRNSNRSSPSTAVRWNIPTVIVAVTLLGYNLGTPLMFTFLGREYSGISFELLFSLLLLLFAVQGFVLLLSNRYGRYSLLAFGGMVAWIFLGALNVRPAAYRDLINPLGNLAILCGSAGLFGYYWPSIAVNLKTIIFMICCVFMFWLASMFLSGKYLEFGLMGTTDAQQYTIGDLLPTELSLMLGSMFCYTLFAIRSQHGFSQLITIHLAIILVALTVIVSGSIGAIAGLILVILMFFLSRKLSLKIRLIIIISICVTLSCGVLQPYIESMQSKADPLMDWNVNKSSRAMLYQKLWNEAKDNPIFGIGLNQFVELDTFSATRRVCHQNILGRAAENGFPAAALYSLFIVTTLWSLWYRRSRRSVPNTPITITALYFMETCLWSFILYQFRGLFMDTWSVKQLFFVAGAGLGCRIWLDVQNHQRPPLSRKVVINT
jgi:hypothetical protein